MRTRSIETNRAYPCLALATVALLVATLATPGAAYAEEQPVAGAPPMLVAAIQRIDPSTIGTDPDKGTLPPGDGRDPSAAASLREIDVNSDQATASVIVGARLPDPEPDAWDGFRQSMASAATSSCFDPDALPHQGLTVQGLLRLPLLVTGAADGSCR